MDAELTIEVPFVLRDSAGEWLEIDPGVSTGALLAPVIDLFKATVTELELGTTGSLRLAFDTGAELHVSPHPKYESWNLNGHGVMPTIVGPGGETDWTMAH